jgi:hypothetical protein
MSVDKLATELTLKTLLIETVGTGIEYALHVRDSVTADQTSDKPQAQANINREGMRCAANILASILPGVCPAEIMTVYESLPEKVMATYAYCGMDMNDVEKVLALIEKQSEEVENCGS